MGKTVHRTVHIFDESGASHVLQPGDSVPKWAEDQVTNPKVFVASDEPVDQEPEEVVTRHGDPSGSWTHDELDAYAAANEVEWSSSSLTKADKVNELGFGDPEE